MLCATVRTRQVENRRCATVHRIRCVVDILVSDANEYVNTLKIRRPSDYSLHQVPFFHVSIMPAYALVTLPMETECFWKSRCRVKANEVHLILTNSKEQSRSWKANSPWASEKISSISWHSKVHYWVHTSPPLPLIQNQVNPVHVPTFHFLKIHFNIIPSTPGSSEWSRSLGFPIKTLNGLILSPYVLHTQLILFSIWSPAYLMKSTDREASC